MLTKNITQIGIIVRDVATAAAAYAAVFGMEVPEIVMTEPEEAAHTRYREWPTPARAKLAFFHFNNITVELIEPVGGPSTWNTFLEEKGEGVHHIAFDVAGMNENIAHLDGKGFPIEQQGEWTGASPGRYAYIDSASELAVTLELLENF